jgi:hypothetical protein
LTLLVPGLSYEEVKGMEGQAPEVTELLHKVQSDAQQGKADAALFAADALQSPDFIRRAGAGFLARGALKSLTLLERREEGGNQLFTYQSVFGETTILWAFALNKEGKILKLMPRE